ncbi:MAG TPA: DUF3499 family protein [Actinomycetota bacterium]|nr:DUF3499 family protein [Actinomycetota bacterium]
MRHCARMSCPDEPVATISLRYADRRILISELPPVRDPRLLDLCPRHLAAMTPPVGFLVDDARLADFIADRH